MSGETGGTDEPHVAFLNEAARYFENRPTGGEDREHWANVYNAENCRKVIETLTSLRAELSLALDTVDMNYHHCKQAEERAETAESSLAAEKQRADNAVYALKRFQEAVDSRPDFETLWAEQSEAREALEQRVAALVGALTPAAATKAAYIGEFKFNIEDRDEEGDECQREVVVPWTTVKEVMKAISDRATEA